MKYNVYILALVASLLAMATQTLADHDDDHGHKKEVHPNTPCVVDSDCHKDCKENEYAVCGKPENECHCHAYRIVDCAMDSDCVKACNNTAAVCFNDHHCHCDEDPAPDCHIKYQQFENHTMCLTKSPNAMSVEMTDELRQKIVHSHNWRRSQVEPPATNMLKMRWSFQLEKMAKKWADACEFRGGMHHDKTRFIPGDMFVGQSMASHTLNFFVAIDTWWSEKMQYQYGTYYRDQAKENLCPHVIVGHYTQIAWADTYLVGCAATRCGEEVVTICNYGPTGNLIPFDRPYQAGERGSACKKVTNDGDIDGLCDCGDMYCYNGNLNPTTCQCECKFAADDVVPSFINKTDCSLDCSGRDFAYCGDEVFNNCNEQWTSKKCPHMCKVCPYAEKNYATKDHHDEL